MLSIGACSSGQGNYYINLARSDYYLSGGEPQGVWHGEGAARLGAVGPVTELHFRSLFAGYLYETAKALTQNAGDAGRRPAWDLTFSAPKSVSVLWATLDEQSRDQIRQAHDAAVKKTLDYLERELLECRRGKDGTERESAQLVSALFEHGTSRLHDPQLHTHALVFNICTRQDGTTGAIESRSLYTNKMLLGAMYRAELAHLLERKLGLVAEQTGQTFEVRGVPNAICNAFSRRRAEIQAFLNEKGLYSAEASAYAALKTRSAKEHAPRADLFPLWQKTAAALGFTPLRATLSQLYQEARRSLKPGETAQQRVQAALKDITRQESHFSERDLLKATLLLAPGSGQSLEELMSAVKTALTEGAGIARLGELNGEVRYSTREIIELEQKMLTAVKATRKQDNHEVTSARLWWASYGKSLHPEQENAVRHITQTAGGVKVVSGLAGTGKTRMLDVARTAWEGAGYKVLGLALAGKAARGLQEGSGIKSSTVASILYRMDMGWLKLDSKMVLVMDEAGMVDTRSMARLIHAAKDAGAKMVLVGDAKQLQPIELGGAFRAIGAMLGEATLTRIQRQSAGWARKAVAWIADGQAEEALKEYAERGLITISETREETRRQLIGDWRKAGGVHLPEENLILTATRAEAEKLNFMAQQERKRMKQLDGRSTKMGNVTFHEGERILFLKNNSALGVKNGDFATIKKIDVIFKTVKARLDNGKAVYIPLRKYDQISLGYAATTHKAQGVTVKRTFVLTGDPMTDLHLGYVQASRARYATRIYLERQSLKSAPLQTLARQWSRENEKTLALDIQEQALRIHR